MTITEKSYQEMLKETVMLKHTGSGPVDPAPKEKETKSPEEDGTGEGTKQAATGHPNKIPPIAYLKKELAKEGIELVGETKEEIMKELHELPMEAKSIVQRLAKNIKDASKLAAKGRKMQKKAEKKRQDDFVDKLWKVKQKYS